MHALADVPGVVVTAHDDDLLGALAPGDLGDDVEGLDVGQRLRPHL